MKPKGIVLIATLLASVSCDQLSKLWVSTHISIDSIEERRAVIEGFFYIAHSRNAGAAFNLLLGWPATWRLSVFVAVAALAVVVVIVFYRGLAPGDRFNSLALGLVMGGAIGNLTDRIVRGEVIDFLHFELWRAHSWPDFNLADLCIVSGVVALMLELLAREGASRAETRDHG